MRRAIANVRPDERRDTWAAFAVLFGLIASHAILETARDALFLSKVPASRLPWVYIAIAVLSLVVNRLQARLARRLAGRAALSLWIASAGVITFGFWLAGDRFGDQGLYALYIWSGVLTTLVLIHFWTLLGDLFTITQAKRLFALIGSGSVMGAIAGSAAAGALARVVSPDHLLLASAAGMGVTALLPALFGEGTGSRRADDTDGGGDALLAAAAYVVRQPYARRVAALLVVSAAAVTVADFLFKATVAAEVPADELGTYFATIYLVLNVLSLLAQLFLVGWLVRRFDLAAALSLLPLLLLGGGVGLLATGGLVAAIAIKGADGSLRYSLHKTTTELLFVPMSEHARRRVKAFIDVVGQRGGQSVAAAAILVVIGLELDPRVLAASLIALAALWIVCAVDLRRFYLDIFRRRLDRGIASRLDQFPELDVGSLETLIAALDSTDDREVAAALDVLEREGKTRLIPALILYHPSEDIVERALDVFARSGRTHAASIAKRLADNHASPRIRGAAIAALSVLAPDERGLRMRLSMEDSADVRATIMVNLIASGAMQGTDARDALDSLIANGSTATRVSLAQAIGRRQADGFDDVLARLAGSADNSVRRAAARAIGRLGRVENLPVLVELLASEHTRAEAQRSILGFGGDGFDAVAAALRDRGADRTLRWQLPRTIAQFATDDAAALLLGNLPGEWDGMVRYRSMRALEAMRRRDPTLELDAGTLQKSIEATVSRCYRYLDRRVILERGAEADPARATPGHDVLRQMLDDKVSHALDRLFRLLELAYPGEEFREIYRSLSSDSRESRAGSLELIENLLKPLLRGAVVGLVDDLPGAERLSRGSRFHTPMTMSYDDLLASMLASSSLAVQDLTVFHIGELGLRGFRADIEALAVGADASRTDFARTLALLDAGAPDEEARVAD